MERFVERSTRYRSGMPIGYLSRVGRRGMVVSYLGGVSSMEKLTFDQICLQEGHGHGEGQVVLVLVALAVAWREECG